MINKKHRRVFWSLWGDRNIGSSRIHGYNIHDAMLKKGIKSKVLHYGNNPLSIKKKLWMLIYLRRGDLFIIQKQKDLTINSLLFFLKTKGVSIAFVDCDVPICSSSFVKYLDFIICASRSLATLYKENYPQKKTTYIPDAIEYFIEREEKLEKKAIYFGWLTDQRFKKINSLKKLLKSIGWSLDVMSNDNRADIQYVNWKDKATFKIIGKYTASIIPIDDDKSAKFKSANRVLQSLALGNVVLCGDIESYNEVVENGKNGFICSGPDQWIMALNEIANEHKRIEIIRNGFKTAQNYSMDKIILEWMSFLRI